MRTDRLVMATLVVATMTLALVASCEGRSEQGAVSGRAAQVPAEAHDEAEPMRFARLETTPVAPQVSPTSGADSPPADNAAAFGALGAVPAGFALGSGNGTIGRGGGPEQALRQAPAHHAHAAQRPAHGHPTTPPTLGAPPPVAPPRNLGSPLPVAPPPPAALPTSGVLASNFVGGTGAAARLEDLLERGVLVGGRNVRLEAFDDLGRLPYEVPSTKAVALYANLERGKLLAAGEKVHLQIAIMARQGELPVRPRMDVRLVLDRSGSMEGDKWTQAIAAAHALVDRLQPSDTFGLVSYSDSATGDLAPARLGDRRAAHAAIDRLVPGGGTNIDGALAAVQSVPPRRQSPSDVLLVVLLSDGQATVGQTSPEAIAQRARQVFDATGAITTTVGVGTDFDERTMLGIARESSGSYYFVRRSADIAGILTDELEQRVQAVAEDLRLRIELAPGVVPTQVYGSRMLDAQEAAAVRGTEVAVDERAARELGIVRDRQVDDDRGLRMHIPTFRRGDQHVVLLELSVPPGTDPSRVATVSLDWKDVGGARNDHARVEVSAPRTGDAQLAAASTSREVKRTVLAFRAASALQGTAAALDRGDASGAQRSLDEELSLLRTARDLWADRALDRDVHLLEQYRQVVASAWPTWDEGSRHTLVLAMNYYGDRRMR